MISEGGKGRAVKMEAQSPGCCTDQRKGTGFSSSGASKGLKHSGSCLISSSRTFYRARHQSCDIIELFLF